MATKALKINISSELLIALNITEKELQKEMRVNSAIRFYQEEKLTIGKAAQFAEMNRYEFEKLLAENNIPISNLEFDDIEMDLSKLKNL
ncbi:MAG: UPF0175 family protein [bacterium]|nr:UPF0175 family protein [bacterium]